MEQLYQHASIVGQLLKDRGDTIAVAESSTGGLISAALLGVSGASAYFIGGGIIYTREARRQILNLSEDQITMPGASEAYALVCARAIREKMGTTWGLSETGATGPTGNRYGNPAGHVAIAVSGPVERAMVLQTGLSDRQQNMARFADTALGFLEGLLRD